MDITIKKFFSKDDGLFYIERINNYYPYDKQEETFENLKIFIKQQEKILKMLIC